MRPDIPLCFDELTRLVLKNCSTTGRYLIELEIRSADEEPREELPYQRVGLNHSLVDNRHRPRIIEAGDG
ncbi:MAG TPA: hypothetical protein VLE70_11260 [Anaerolineae bacterium]|nr:hypothetical protein [Anaerolineae bacterium]